MRYTNTKAPSEKQSKYVRDIIRWLGKEPPHEFSAAAYYRYIKENIDELKKVQANYYEERSKTLWISSYKKSGQSKHHYYSVMDEEEDADWRASMDFDW